MHSSAHPQTTLPHPHPEPRCPPQPSPLTRPSLWSARVQASMKVWAMTKSTASMLSDVCTSNTNCGFLMMLIQNLSGRLRAGRAGEAGGRAVEAESRARTPDPPASCPPVGLPDVDSVLVGDAMLLGLLIQQVKEVLNGKWHGAAGAEDHLEQVVHKLLQGALRGGDGPGCWSARGPQPRPSCLAALGQCEPRATPSPAPACPSLPPVPPPPTFMDSRRVR